MKTRLIAILITLTTIVSFPSCDLLINLFPPSDDAATASIDSFMNHEAIISTPMSDDLAFIEVNGNKPQFTEEDFNNGVYYYKLTPLDELGRVGVAIGLFDAEHMPDGERGDIDSVTPTGWKTDGKSNNCKYDFVEAGWIYNRCHILGFQISGLNDVKENLLTGTRFFNIEGNLAYENLIADHLEEMDGTNGEPMHQVLIRVTPDFGNGYMMPHGEYYEADCLQCDDIYFNVYMFNKQPGVTINYRTGENWANGDDAPPEQPEEVAPEDATYILNLETEKFHRPNCSSAPKVDSDSYFATDMTREDVIAFGYSPCKTCKP